MMLRMQELEDPWTHWFRSDRPGGLTLLQDYFRAHATDEDYMGIPGVLIAKSDGFQGLFPEQLRALVQASRETWKLRRELDKAYLPTPALEKEYMARMEADKARFFR